MESRLNQARLNRLQLNAVDDPAFYAYGIASEAALGTPTMHPGPAFFPTAIASEEAVGTPEFSAPPSFNLRGYGIPSEEALGSPVFLEANGRLVNVLMGGVDRTAFVGVGIRRSQQLSAGSVSTCQFSMNNGNGRSSYTPDVNDEVIIYALDPADNQRKLFFAGRVESVKKKIHGGTSGLVETEVSCSDYGSLLTRRIVGRHYELLEGGIATITITNMLAEFVPEIALAPDYPGEVNATLLGLQDFNFIPAAEAISQIAAKANFSYRVDYSKQLHLFTGSDGYASAPYTLAPGDGNFLRAPEVTTSRSGRANRVGVRNSRDMAPIWTDTFIADGSTNFFGPVNAAFLQKPVITLDDVELTVVEFGDFASAWDVWYSPGDRVIQFNPAAANPTGTIEVKYPSRLSYIAWAPDGTLDADLRDAALTDQATHGKSELIIEAKDLADIDAMQAYADGALARYLLDPVSIDFGSDKYGWEAGQLVTANISGYAGDYLIESVDSEEQGKAFFRHRCKATNAPQRSASGIRAFGSLLAAARQPVDRITYKIGFTLAETIDGLTNPGLMTGLHPSNQRGAEKDGTLRDVTVYFRSSDASPLTLTEADCTFDIYKNGTSIFGANKLTWPAGATSVQVRFLFVSNPMTVQRGDEFTLEVLTADAAAMDGKVELTVLG